MAGKLSMDKLWINAICPICAKYFTDPVSLKCGHNFCRNCITRCWGELSVVFICPRRCGYFLKERKYESNRKVADFVEATKQIVERMKEEAKGWENCREHQLPLNLFCEDDQATLCSWCEMSEAHRNHKVTGVSFTDQCYAYKDIPYEMGSDLSIYPCNFEKVSQGWLRRMEAERKKTIATFKDLRQFLDGQERLRLARLVDLEKEIMKKKDKYDKKVSNQITLLNSIHGQMEDEYKDVRKFLQDFGNALYSDDGKQLENPVLLPTDVKDKVSKFCDRKLFLEEVLKEFNDEMAAFLKGRRRKRTRTEVEAEERGTRVDVTLDQDTANHHIVLSADRKKMYFSEFYRDLPNGLKRFQFTPCVLGHQAFTSGRHWWEVKVEGNGCGWAIGVARESLKRIGRIDIWDEEGIWVEGIWFVGKKSGGPMSHRRLLAFSRPKSTLLILARKPEKIRVCLNYPGGQVEFFNAETDELIFVFRSCSFLGEKVHPFFWVFGLSVTVRC